MQVQASDGKGGLSGWKETLAAFTTLPPPNHPPTLPGAPTVASGTVTASGATVSWGASTDPDGDIITYELQYSRYNDLSDPWHSAGTTTSLTRSISGLAAGTSYDVRVQASDGLGGLSSWNETYAAFTTGGNPSTRQGVDYSVYGNGATATTGVDVPGIKAAGKQFVGEYIGTADNDGYLRPADVLALTNQGLQIVSIFERTPTSASYFTLANADHDAAVAIAAAIEAGQPSGSAVYFTVDFDPESNPSTFSASLSAIDSYFQEIRNAFNQYFSAHPGITYDIGVYAPGNVLPTIMSDASVGASYSWLAGPFGYPYSSANLAQTQDSTPSNPISIGGINVDLDEAYTADFGQWPASTTGTTPPAPVIRSPKLVGTTFTLSVPTQIGFNYTLEYKNSFGDANWTSVQTIGGTGGTITLTDTSATGPSRLYHVRVE